jgi:xanthine dehydrogenase molybdenum-binding subunit
MWRGSLQGGVAQGVGWALNEEYVYDDKGRLLNASLLDYRMPTALDLPMIDTVLVEVANPGHPYGVRGVGETPIVPPPPPSPTPSIRHRRAHDGTADVAPAGVSPL